MHKFFVGRRGDAHISDELLNAMYRQRHQVFYERLRWDVPSHGGLEYDQFDNADTVYVIARNLRTREVDASWRLRPTTAPYMLKEVFPQLLGDHQAPSDPDVWEVSRFAVSNTPYACGISQMGELSQDLLALTVKYAVDHAIHGYVWVTSTGVERLGTKLGYRPRRFGAPQRIGHVNCVAGEIEIDARAGRIAEQRLQAQRGQEAA